MFKKKRVKTRSKLIGKNIYANKKRTYSQNKGEELVRK